MRLPLDAEQYHPDTREPVDRWFQTPSASNVRTTMAVISDLVRRPPTAVVDPFAGGGSTASAARLMGLPFVGIEIDPVLVCVSTAKARCTPYHADLLRRLPAVRDLDSLSEVLAALPSLGTPDDTAVASCLAVLMCLRAWRGVPLALVEIAADLESHRPPMAAAQVVCGDATSPAAWVGLTVPAENPVLYTSPQFGGRSPVLDAPPGLVQAARDVLVASSADRGVPAAADGTGFAGTTVAMLRCAAAGMRRATVVVEHEPDDDGRDSTLDVLELLAEALPQRVHDARVVPCGQFTWRGPLSLIVLDLR